MSVLVTGGAGYIGSHVARALHTAGHRVLVVDDLSTGKAEFATDWLIPMSVMDTDRLGHLMSVHDVESVIHLAGFKDAGASVGHPEHALWQNTGGLLSVLAAAAANEVRMVIYSSSAAVYGSPANDADETTPTDPDSPYGLSKLLGEQALAASKIPTVALRYFNVAGSGWPDIYDTSPHNLFPRICDDLKAGHRPTIYGDDYPTSDGTAVRDYVHVTDIAAAHVAALDLSQGHHVYNLGSSIGYSVREVLDEFTAVTGLTIEPSIKPRRPGDPARILADVSRARNELGWEPKLGLADMVTSAWEAHP